MASPDKKAVLWHTSGECDNYGILQGHKGAILDLHWSRDSRVIFSASADMMLASWDLETGQRIRRHIGHEETINCMDLSKRGEELLVSGSDDGYIGIWDPRQKHAIDFIESEFPITAIALSEAGNDLFTGGIDNDIKVWDMRKKAVVYSMIGHTDTITSLQVSPDAQTLLSNSHDNTVRTWDVRPFAPTDRHIRTYDGAPTGMEKNLLKASWDSKGTRIAAGSGDCSVVVWEANSGKLLYKLPGHRGAVNDVRFGPGDEPLLVSGSSDHLSIALTNHHLALPLHILFVLLILSTLIRFLHSLIKFCMLVLRPRHTTTTTTPNLPPLRVNTRIPDLLPHLSSSEHADDDNDFTPTTPVRVHLARDEEAAIGDARTEKDDELDLAMPPPAYGLWRCSVRADPNLLHWRKAGNDTSTSHSHPTEWLVRVTSLPQLSRATGQGQSGLVRHGLGTVDRGEEEAGEGEEMQRPPSYASDDRVELAVAAALRLGSPAVSEMIEVGRTR
ncbi:hypothetical protein B0A49_02101 [Cryomyces minteri]|uniref:Uncharacterized protein n=1 Tax=Cryomyces minteri TaxID=331657 RepID=A0A4U0XU97_9PEZI|nr:hypothetical protein B0A49_02101 [Cryomyces minteri]